MCFAPPSSHVPSPTLIDLPHFAADTVHRSLFDFYMIAIFLQTRLIELYTKAAKQPIFADADVRPAPPIADDCRGWLVKQSRSSQRCGAISRHSAGNQ